MENQSYKLIAHPVLQLCGGCQQPTTRSGGLCHGCSNPKTCTHPYSGPRCPQCSARETLGYDASPINSDRKNGSKSLFTGHHVFTHDACQAKFERLEAENATLRTALEEIEALPPLRERERREIARKALGKQEVSP